MTGEVVEKRGEQLDPASPSQSSVEADLSALFLRFSTGESSVKGFSGLWTFYRADSAEDDAINSSFRCLRTYETLHTDPVTIKFRTFNQMQPGNGVASARPQDGVFESDHSRLATDPFFTDNMILSEAERSEGLPECVFWRCVAVDAQNVLRVAPRLPPSRAESRDKEGQPVYPGWSQQSMTTGVFAFESFLEDGDNRWSLGALYSVSSLRLLSHFCIQEHAVTLDPSRRISFGSLPAKQPKSRLSKDVSSWLDQGSYKGEMQEVIWDEEGEMLKLPTRPAHWSPPDTHSTTHRLFLYPDGMYAYYPCQLPETSASSPNTFNQGARFEMGGLCKENQEFRRLILRYSPAGQVTSLTKELYKASGSFEFEKRQSTSVRRSLDIRRPHTPPGATALSNHARATARAAKLDQAFRNSEETA